MLCPHCQHENLPDAKFCNDCGTRLPAVCPGCGAENPPGSKFCNECGEKLTADRKPQAEVAPVISPPSPVDLMPAAFADKLRAVRETGAMQGERRIVTMLFCDVQGSTAAAGKLDPEDWAEVMNGVFEQMIRPVYKYEGTVARLMGDAILAFFGAPIAHEDDPQRAILAGLDIIAGFKAYRGQIENEWGVEINVRVGINTGLVMVGTVGSDLQMEYTALGDAINLAARMEQTAQAGTVQVSEDTYRLAAPVFEWQALGEMEVKGKEAPVKTYQPLRLKAQPGRLRGIAGLDAPMVGRAGELEILQERMGRLANGQGGIVFISGEAGLGKSRLILELRNTEYASRLIIHEAASLSYEVSQPYALFQRLLRRVYGVKEGDTPVEMWEKFLPILQQFPPDVADGGRVFEALFAARGQTSDAQPEGETFKRQLTELMGHLVTQWAGEAPRVIILDDLHWTDTASIDLLKNLYPLVEATPVLLLCAMRPERAAPGWEARETALREYPHLTREIALTALTAADTDQLVNHLLLVADLPESLRQRILEKTEGNPFFIEEVVRVLIDNGAVIREDAGASGGAGIRWRTRQDIGEIDIPGNLQTLLTARIDRLEEDARRTLQLASVIGRSFYYRILDTINRAVSVVQANLEPQLRTLQRAEMILEAARLPELEYAFRHALTQEAAYGTILLRQRREFHRQVGEAIEGLFADRVDEFYSMLAHHFAEAHDPRALRYQTLAGDAAFRLFAIPEAVNHYRLALELAQSAPRLAGNADWQHLFTRLGRCYELQSQHREAIQTYEDMIARARAAADAQMELAGLIVLGTSLALPTPCQDAARAGATSETALALARQLDDLPAEARIQWNFLLLNMYSGGMDIGIPYGERAAELARSLGMQDVLAHALQDLSLAYMAVGDLRMGRAALEEARPIWEALGNQPMIAETLTNSAFERLMAGEFEAALGFMTESFRISERIQNEWGQVNTRVFISQVYMALGNFDEALRIQEKYIPLARKVGHPGSALILVQQAWTYAHLGQPQRARQSAEAAMQDAASFPPFYAYTLAVNAGYLLQGGDLPRAAELLQKAQSPQKTILEIDIVIMQMQVAFALANGALEDAMRQMDALLALLERAGARYFLPEALSLHAEILLAQGRRAAACTALVEAGEAAREIGFRAILWRILAMLAELAETAGEAATLREEAGEVAAFIAGQITDPDLRADFEGYVGSQGVTSP